MEKFLSIPPTIIKISGFKLILSSNLTQKDFLKNFLIFTLNIFNPIITNILTCISILTNSVNLDNILGASMTTMTIINLCVKICTIYWHRDSIRKIVENFKKVENFSQKTRRKFKKFDKFQSFLYTQACAYTAVSLTFLVYFLSTGNWSVVVYGGFLNKIDSKVSLLIIFWSYSVEICANYVNYLTEVLIYKMIFVMSMEFEELAIKFRMLKEKNFGVKIFRRTSDPLIVGRRKEKVEIYPNLLSKLPMKVRRI